MNYYLFLNHDHFSTNIANEIYEDSVNIGY